MRVRAREVGDRRRREARMPLEDLRRFDLCGLGDARRPIKQLLREVGTLAVDDAEALADAIRLRGAVDALIRHDARRLRPSHHRDLEKSQNSRKSIFL